jgi:hypothetical protein
MPQLTLPITEHGAIVEIRIGVIEACRKKIEALGLPPPKVATIRAQIDTGASGSAISRTVLDDLAIKPINRVKVVVPSEDDQPREFEAFPVSILLSHPDLELYLPVYDNIIGCYFSTREPFQALLGRDVLRHCLLIYNGETESFTFAF